MYLLVAFYLYLNSLGARTTSDALCQASLFPSDLSKHVVQINVVDKLALPCGHGRSSEMSRNWAAHSGSTPALAWEVQELVACRFNTIWCRHEKCSGFSVGLCKYVMGYDNSWRQLVSRLAFTSCPFVAFHAPTLERPAIKWPDWCTEVAMGAGVYQNERFSVLLLKWATVFSGFIRIPRLPLESSADLAHLSIVQMERVPSARAWTKTILGVWINEKLRKHRQPKQVLPQARCKLAPRPS